jgi:hypothetical protein
MGLLGKRAAEQRDAADKGRRGSRPPTSRLRTPVQRFALALRARVCKGQRPAALAAYVLGRRGYGQRA